MWMKVEDLEAIVGEIRQSVEETDHDQDQDQDQREKQAQQSLQPAVKHSNAITAAAAGAEASRVDSPIVIEIE